MNREDIADIIEEYELNELNEKDIDRAVEMLAEGTSVTSVIGYMATWNRDIEHENRCDDLASADFEERAYGRD